MRRRLQGVVIWGAVCAMSQPALAQHVHPHKPIEADGSPGSVTGHIRDAACLFRNPQAGAPDDPVALECAQKCVLGGSPLVVWTDDDKMYFVLSDVIPDLGQGKKYYAYIGKRIKASGRVFERAGSHAIAIETIELLDKRVENSPGKVGHRH